MKSDKEILALALAGSQIDIMRFMNLEALPEEEKECLLKRSANLIIKMEYFIKNGSDEPFNCIRLSSTEDWREKMKEKLDGLRIKKTKKYLEDLDSSPGDSK